MGLYRNTATTALRICISSGHGFSRAAQAQEGRAALAAEGMSFASRQPERPGTYFVTSRTWQSRMLFVTEPCCTMFIDSCTSLPGLKEYFPCMPSCLMPDHFHMSSDSARREKRLEEPCNISKAARHANLPWNGACTFQFGSAALAIIAFETKLILPRTFATSQTIRSAKSLICEAKEFRWSSASGTYALDRPPQGLKLQFLEGIALRHG